MYIIFIKLSSHLETALFLSLNMFQQYKLGKRFNSYKNTYVFSKTKFTHTDHPRNLHINVDMVLGEITEMNAEAFSF